MKKNYLHILDITKEIYHRVLRLNDFFKENLKMVLEISNLLAKIVDFITPFLVVT